MPIYPIESASIDDVLMSNAQRTVDLPDPLAPQPEPTGFLRSFYLGAKLNSITGQAVNRLGWMAGGEFDAMTSEVDPKFNPYDYMNDDFLRRHPYTMPDFESGRVLEFKNQRQFEFYLARKSQDFQDRQELDRGSFIGSLAGAIVTDVGAAKALKIAATVGNAALRSAIAGEVQSELAFQLTRGGKTIATAEQVAKAGKGVGLLGAAATNIGMGAAQETALQGINSDRNVDYTGALTGAVVIGAALAVLVPAGIYGLRAAGGVIDRTSLGPYIGTPALDYFRRVVQREMTNAKFISTVEGAIDANVGELQRMLDDTPVGPVTVASLRGPQTESLVKQIVKKWGDAGFTVHEASHPAQADVDFYNALKTVEKNTQGFTPDYGKAGTGFIAERGSSMLPGGRARQAPTTLARRFARLMFKDSTAISENVDNPLGFQFSASAEMLRQNVRILKHNWESAADDAIVSHFKNKGGPITSMLSDGTVLEIAGPADRRKLAEAAADLIRYEADIKRGGTPNPAYEPHGLVKEYADAWRNQYIKPMLDAGERAGIFKGNAALDKAEAELKLAQAESDKWQNELKTRFLDDKELNEMSKAEDLRNAKANEVKDIKQLIANAEDYITRRWRADQIGQAPDEFKQRLVDEWKRNRETDFNTGKPVDRGEREVNHDAINSDFLTKEQRRVLRNADIERRIGQAERDKANAIEAQIAAMEKDLAKVADPQSAEAVRLQKRIDKARDRVTNIRSVIDDPALMTNYENAVNEYFKIKADAVVEHLTNPDNTHGVAAAFSDTSPMKGRHLMVRESKFREFLDSDLYSVGQMYDNIMSGQIAARQAIRNDEAFWSPLVKSVLGKDLADEAYNPELVANVVRRDLNEFTQAAYKIGDAEGGKAATAARDVANVLDTNLKLLRGMRVFPGDPATDAAWRSVGNIAMRLPVLSSLGNLLFSQFADAAGHQAYAASTPDMIEAVGRSFLGMLPGMKPTRRGLEAIIAAVDQTSSRYMMLGELEDMPTRAALQTSPLGRGLDAAEKGVNLGVNKMFEWTGANRWTTSTRTVAGRMVMSHIIEAAQKMAEAGELVATKGMTQEAAFAKVGLAAEDATRMSRLGFNARRARELIDTIMQHGETLDGKKLSDMTFKDVVGYKGYIDPNGAAWHNTNRQLFDTLTAAINAEITDIVVEPSMLSRPLMNNRFVGKAVNQFGGFALAWTNQALPMMAQRPATQQANYVMYMIGLGAVADALHNEISGRRKLEDTVAMWEQKPLAMFISASERSGLWGWMSRFNGVAQKAGVAPAQLLGNDVSSTYSAQSLNWMGALAGPSFDYWNRVANGVVTPALPGNKYDAQTLHLVRTTLPFQNLIWHGAAYDFTKRMGINNPIGPGRGLDLYLTKPPIDEKRANNPPRRQF